MDLLDHRVVVADLILIFHLPPNVELKGRAEAGGSADVASPSRSDPQVVPAATPGGKTIGELLLKHLLRNDTTLFRLIELLFYGRGMQNEGKLDTILLVASLSDTPDARFIYYFQAGIPMPTP